MFCIAEFITSDEYLWLVETDSRIEEILRAEPGDPGLRDPACKNRVIGSILRRAGDWMQS
jgi:hypothetical protein